MKFVLFLWSVVNIFGYNEGFKVLVVFPVPAKSHSILGDGYVRHLLAAGHEVTLITPYPKDNPQQNLTFVDVSENLKAFPADMLNLQQLMDGKGGLNDDNYVFGLFTYIASLTVKNEKVQKLLNEPAQKFDVIIAEWMFSELYSSFSAVFDCPFIWSGSVDPHWMVLRLIHEANSPALYPDIQSTNIPPFTFKQRVEELWCQIYTAVKRYFIWDALDRNNYEKYIVPAIVGRNKPVPSFDELKFSPAMLLANTDVSLGQPITLPPNCKTIGGYHINEHIAPLPKDLQTLMDNAKHGVIYFSMGSNLPSSDLPEELKKGFLKIFGELKQTILWKFEEILPDLPDNVHVLQWAPQQSILAHPNCVLFITHGGLLSTIETVHFGVPTIGIPVFGDQFINVGRAVGKGYAVKVDLSYTMAGDLKKAIVEVIENPKYAEKVKELSQVYHDRPVPPGQELVHWVEHVVKTRGAPHLRSPALLVPWYQKMYLDLLAIIVMAILFINHVIKKLWNVCNKPAVNKKKTN